MTAPRIPADHYLERLQGDEPWRLVVEEMIAAGYRPVLIALCVCTAALSCGGRVH